MHAMPVHSGDLWQPVLHDHSNLLTARHPQRWSEKSGAVSTVAVAPGRSRYSGKEFCRSFAGAEVEDPDTVVINCGFRECRYPEPVAEVERVDGAKRRRSGAIDFTAHQRESRQGR
jgi:hypothetical protein